MAITHLLSQSNFYSSQLHSFPTKYHNNIALKKNYCIKTTSKFNSKSFIMRHKVEEEKGDSLTTKVATETGMKKVSWSSMENVVKALQVWIITGFVLGLLLMYDGRVALAASGGRMGGRSFSSRSSSRSYSRSSGRSRSYSSRSSRPSYSSSEGYSTLIGSPAHVKAAAVEPSGFDAFMGFTVLVVLIYFAVKGYHDDQDAAKTSVLKLQVGLLGMGRSLQRELNRIGESADTSTSQGLNYVVQETILALLRHSDHCISGYSSVDVKKSELECEKRFDQLSIEERGKFDEETLVNVNNIKKKSTTSQSSNGLLNEYIVVTIIVAARGVPDLPPIKSSEQLKKALQKLASIPSSNIMGAEVLWTPQKEDDSLSEQQMLEDYPLLHPL